MHVLQHGLIKIGALISYCGGPLIVNWILKPRLGAFMAFGVTFVPIVLMILGGESLFGSGPRRRRFERGGRGEGVHSSSDGAGWEVTCVRLGLVGALVTLLMHGYGAWILATTPPRPDHGLYLFGIIVGIPLAAVYACAARRWLSRVKTPQDPFSPIEPK